MTNIVTIITYEYTAAGDITDRLLPININDSGRATVRRVWRYNIIVEEDSSLTDYYQTSVTDIDKLTVNNTRNVRE